MTKIDETDQVKALDQEAADFIQSIGLPEHKWVNIRFRDFMSRELLGNWSISPIEPPFEDRTKVVMSGKRALVEIRPSRAGETSVWWGYRAKWYETESIEELLSDMRKVMIRESHEEDLQYLE